MAVWLSRFKVPSFCCDVGGVRIELPNVVPSTYTRILGFGIDPACECNSHTACCSNVLRLLRMQATGLLRVPQQADGRLALSEATWLARAVPRVDRR